MRTCGRAMLCGRCVCMCHRAHVELPHKLTVCSVKVIIFSPVPPIDYLSSGLEVEFCSAASLTIRPSSFSSFFASFTFQCSPSSSWFSYTFIVLIWLSVARRFSRWGASQIALFYFFCMLFLCNLADCGGSCQQSS